jgi:HSP20 family protein
MHTIIHPTPSNRSSRAALTQSTAKYRQPNYDCREFPDAIKLTVYAPGVNPASIEIEVRGSDIVITARKPHIVRVNWQALHLESAQRDYRLRLRLGFGFDYSALHAEFHDGVFSLTLPKLQPIASPTRIRDVA